MQGRNQNPRVMPPWFNNGSNLMGNPPPPPPQNFDDNSSLPLTLPQNNPQNRKKDPDYEEIDHFRQPRVYNNTGNSTGTNSQSCSLCGNSMPVVRCEMCNLQIFCGPCNDMYHRHPKRKSHIRTLLQLPSTEAPEVPSFIGRPPLPPKQTFTHQIQIEPQNSNFGQNQNQNQNFQNSRTTFSDGSPIPPPRFRSRQSGRFFDQGQGQFQGTLRPATSTPHLHFIKQKTWDPVGTLKRFVGGLTGSSQPIFQNKNFTTPPPSPTLNRRCSTPTGTGHHFQNSNSNLQRNNVNHDVAESPIPLTVLEMDRNQKNPQDPNSNQILNSNLITSQIRSSPISSSSLSHSHVFQTRQSAPLNDLFPRNRGQDLKFSTENSTHFGTLQRQRKNSNSSISSSASSSQMNLPPRPPPPLPPKDFPPINPTQTRQNFNQPMFQSTSVFDLRYSDHSPDLESQFQPISPPNHQNLQNWSYNNMNMNMPRAPSTSSMSGLPSTSWETDRFYGNTQMHQPPALPPKKPQIIQSHIQERENLIQSQFNSLIASVSPRASSVSSSLRGSLRSLDIRESDEEIDEGELSDGGQSNISVFEIGDFSNPKDLTEDPQGPWPCEHCTFINPKSSRICTVCCKTPSKGFLLAKGAKRITKSGSEKPANAKPSIIKSKLSFPASSKLKSEVKTQNSINLSEERTPLDEYENRINNKNPGQNFRKNSNEDVYGSVKLGIHRPDFSNPARGSGQTNKYGDLVEKKIEKMAKKASLRDSGAGSYSTSSSSGSSAVHIPTQVSAKMTQNLAQNIDQSTKGTSPPPQTISTQTYDVLPGAKAKSKPNSKARRKSIDSINSDDSDEEDKSSTSLPRRASPIRSKLVDDLDIKPPAEMSEKALRYARRAQQHSKLKRSLSTHLTSGDGQQIYESEQPLYRSLSRHSLAYDPRGFPSDSRDSSPPPNFPHHHQHSQFPGNFSGNFPNSPGKSRLGQHSLSGYVYPQQPQINSAFYPGQMPGQIPAFNPQGYFPQPLNQPQMPQNNWDSISSQFQPQPQHQPQQLPTNPAEYFASMEDMGFGSSRRRESIRSQEWELSRLLKEAEEFNFSPEDVQVALRMCGDRHPIKWLQENWPSMVETVQTLATKYGREKGPELNDIGTISTPEAREALRIHKGNVWAAVSECSSQRRKKFLELQSRGAFIREDVLTALTANHGNLEAAYIELSKAQLKPFLMRIWGPPSGQENEAIPTPRSRSSATSTKNSIDLQDFPQGFLYSGKFEPEEESIISAEDLEDPEEEDSDLDPDPDPIDGENEDFLYISNKNEPKEPDVESLDEIKANSLLNLLRRSSLDHEQGLIEDFLKSSQSQMKNDLFTSISNISNPSKVQKGKAKRPKQGSSRASIVSAPPTTMNPKIFEQKMMTKTGFRKSSLKSLGGAKENTIKLRIHRAQIEKNEIFEEKVVKLPPLRSPLRSKADIVEQMDDLHWPHEEIVQGKLVLPGKINENKPTISEDKGQSSKSNSNEVYLERSKELMGQIDAIFYDKSKSESSQDIDRYIDEDDDDDEYETYSDIDDVDDIEEINDDDEVYEQVEFADQIPKILEIKKEIQVSQKENSQENLQSKNVYPLVKPLSPFQIKVQGLVDSGKIDNSKKAEMAIQLMDMNFGEEDSISAAAECSSMYSALSFLQQECTLCAGKFSAKQMISMIQCTHSCCKVCARNYFSVQLRDNSILDLTCPFCKAPNYLAQDTDQAAEYFNHLDIMLKNILDENGHEMFQRKLRDWALAKTPNFKWCSKCSSGFITEPLQTRLICPDCKAVTCAICLAPWDRNHDHKGGQGQGGQMTSSQSQIEQKLCDRNESSRSVLDFLNENSIECPQCHLKFALARGGCMHLTCSQCKYEFCSGCSAQFRMGAKCSLGTPFCEKLGLHAHHPRNCLFYLRDKEPEELAKLLEDNAIPYLRETIEPDIPGQVSRRKCQVPIQKELDDGELVDDICGENAPKGFANICIAHYIEYLGLLIWQNHLDPVSILNNDDLETIIRRTSVKFPGKPFGISPEDYRNRLLKVINEQIPL